MTLHATPDHSRHAIAARCTALTIAVMLLAGCATGQGKPAAHAAGTPIAEMTAIAQRLPARLGNWVRVSEPAGDQMVGLMTRFRHPGTPAWASVFVYHPELIGGRIATAVPDGPDGVLARNDQAQFGTERTFDVHLNTRLVQRCQVAHRRSAAPAADYVCSAAVDGYLIKIRVTAPIQVDVPREWQAADVMTGIFAGQVMQAVMAAPRQVGQRT